MREYLAFDTYHHTPHQHHTLLNTKTDSVGNKYYGEINADGNRHGRGIFIYPDGDIYIEYFDTGATSPGKSIAIWSDGDFRVGEIYLKDRQKCKRGTWYKIDGTTEEFD